MPNKNSSWDRNIPVEIAFNPVAALNAAIQQLWRALMKLFSEIVIAMLVLALGVSAFAQGPHGMRNYDPKTEVTVKGTVEDVQQQAARKNGRMGTHLILKTDSGTLPIHVGPSAYIANKQFSFVKGDEIEVLGSKVSIGGKETLLAREITKQGKTLVLRNAQGVPQWAGGPRY